MKTNLDNIWQICSRRNLQQNCMEQTSDLFVQHCCLKFQDEIKFFILQQWNIEISRFRKLS